MDATVAVSESGHKRRITKLETAAKPLAKSVANGDQRAMQLVAHLIKADDPRPRRRSPSASARATPSSCPRSSAASRGPDNDRGPFPMRVSHFAAAIWS